MSENNNTLADITLTTEELLGPPKIDLTGIGMMMLLAMVVGFCSSIGIVLVAFFSLGNFSLQSGVSPMLLAMISFFALTIGNMLYVWGAKTIFPHIYAGTRTIYLHISIFSIILYMVIVPLYLITSMTITEASTGILSAYMIHVLLNIFGLEIIVNALSGYRYLLLSIYASFMSFVITATILFFLYQKTSSSSTNAIFVLLGLSAVAFLLSIFFAFFIRFCYYQWYVASGSDPIGNAFAQVENEEKAFEKVVENQLLGK